VPTADDDRAFAHVVARRNLFSSAAHDYHHVLLGADTSPAGEALVGRYEYRHLLEPGRLMNTVNAVVLLALTGRWRALFAVWRGFRVIRATPDPAGIDGEALWDQPLSAVRRRLGLPADGLMRSGR
jgi:ubiquinone biosynthesis protein Coq4